MNTTSSLELSNAPNIRFNNFTEEWDKKYFFELFDGEFTNQVQTCPFNERKGRKRRENSGLVPKEQRTAERCVARASTRLAFRTSPSAARIGRTACAIDC